MITYGFRNENPGHVLREFVTPSRPCTLLSDMRALALILAPWAIFGLVIGVFG